MEMHERLHRVHAQSRLTKLQLERKMSEKINKEGVHLDPNLNDDMKQMIEDATESVHQTHPPHSFQHLFWEQQKKASSLTDSRIHL